MLKKLRPCFAGLCLLHMGAELEIPAVFRAQHFSTPDLRTGQFPRKIYRDFPEFSADMANSALLLFEHESPRGVMQWLADQRRDFEIKKEGTSQGNGRIRANGGYSFTLGEIILREGKFIGGIGRYNPSQVAATAIGIAALDQLPFGRSVIVHSYTDWDGTKKPFKSIIIIKSRVPAGVHYSLEMKVHEDVVPSSMLSKIYWRSTNALQATDEATRFREYALGFFLASSTPYQRGGAAICRWYFHGLAEKIFRPRMAQEFDSISLDADLDSQAMAMDEDVFIAWLKGQLQARGVLIP